MNKKLVYDEKFEALREGIKEELMRVNAHFNILTKFQDAPNELTNIMNADKYLNFFYYTKQGHFKLFCICLYNVTKYDKQTSNIPYLLCHIKKHQNLFDLYPTNGITDIEKRLNSHCEVIEHVKALRDQYYAHNQLKKKHLPIPLFDEIRTDLQCLLDDLQSIYDSLSFAYDDETTDCQIIIPAPYINQLLTDLTEYKKLKKYQCGNNNQD